jgi:type II secretory pathway pseudopilin PulG
MPRRPPPPGSPAPSPARRRRRAFTIVEVMMAASVMALVISTSITTMQRAFLALDSARNITMAGQVLQTEFERLRLRSWTGTTGNPGINDLTDGAVDLSLDTDLPAAVRARFSLARTVRLVHTDMKQITLTVSWRSYDGRTLSRRSSTYYGREGLYDYYTNSY